MICNCNFFKLLFHVAQLLKLLPDCIIDLNYKKGRCLFYKNVLIIVFLQDS